MPFSALVDVAGEPYRAGALQRGVAVIQTNAAARGRQRRTRCRSRW